MFVPLSDFMLTPLRFLHTRKKPNTYLFNTMIKALCIADSVTDVVLVFNGIRFAGLRPDTYSFPFVLKAVMRLSDTKLGIQVHCQMVVSGVVSYVHVVTAIVQMYSSFFQVYEAEKLFDEMLVRDTVLWNAMLAGYAKVGKMDEALELLDRMDPSVRTVISWTCVVAGYAQMDCSHEAIAVFQRMLVENVQPDEVAFVSVLSACAHLGDLKLGEWIHQYVIRHEFNERVSLNNALIDTYARSGKIGKALKVFENMKNRSVVSLIHQYAIRHEFNERVSLNNALIDTYAKSGKIGKALKVFENMKNRSVVSGTTMIVALAMHGFGFNALQMFSHMEGVGVKPNDITFVAILSACSHVGLVELGHWYFNMMTSTYMIEPKIEHYGCMINLLGRAGLLDEAQELIIKMPFEANTTIWGSLLAASSMHGDLKLGECSLQHLIKLVPHNSGNYALLSNMYSSLGRWNKSRMIRNKNVLKGLFDRGGPLLSADGNSHQGSTKVIGVDACPNSSDCSDKDTLSNGGNTNQRTKHGVKRQIICDTSVEAEKTDVASVTPALPKLNHEFKTACF